MSPLQNALVVLSTLLLSGVVIKAIGFGWYGLAPKQPLNEKLQRQINLFLESKKVVTKEKLHRELLHKDQQLQELKEMLSQVKQELDNINQAASLK
ncbi:hypothetical protein RFI_26813 [Reticulomyxa filosa]|uniref:Uncharacterized protein n=1 Tax=Reticulomyxa filosa TaxID=46433 RepID=X6M979_RETFI|nr:hypothetical protein RFI_26813 [Reticulomyxa filosa]|eukprot:ETO10558.1 hypothetical protein RFI_26813 [Reticulomyxa filosa]